MNPPSDAARPDAPRPRGLYGQRPSASHDAIRRKEFARLAAMTPLERVLLALDLGIERQRLKEGPRSAT
jgi:hypothetical protein